MAETDLQLGGGYTYQWECAILLALNYFFEPVRYNPTLFDLINDFLGKVAEIHLEGEDRESGVDLEDITLVNGDRRILIQVKTKQAEGERWTPTDPLLLKALYRFYDSRFFAEQPDDTRFVFLTNRPFNPDLVQVKSAISEGAVAQCAGTDKLCQHLDRYARKEKGESVDADRFREMLARMALVEYLAVDEVKANVQAKLQAHGRRDWGQAHALLFEHFARQSTRIGGGAVTRESVIEVLGPPPEVAVSEREALNDHLARAVAAYEARMYQHLARPAVPPDQPYKFLYAFEIEDADIFFGREAASEALYQIVLKDRLTILHAKSGAGKTSLLNAGLSPRLIREGRLPVYARAYEDPVLAIKRAIAPPSLGPWPELLHKLTLHEFLGLTCAHLSRQTKELVVILDQFEEFFIFWPEQEHRQPFIDILADCYEDKSLPLRLIVALRKDYYSDLADFQERIPAIFYNEYRLGTMTRREAQAAITGPVTELGRPVAYEQALLDMLLDDLARGGMELPHLQIICTRLYGTLAEGETTITLTSYEKLGWAEGVLGGYLNSVLDRLPGRRRTIAREVLKELVSSEATKRVLSYDTLAARVEAEGNELVDGVLTWLVDARLLRRDEVAGEITYEMAHEYLIEEIQGWIDRTDLEFKLAEELLRREVENWRVHGTLIPRERLELLHAQREQFRGLDDETLECLMHSALQAIFAVEDWAKLVGEVGEKSLLAALNDPREERRQAATRGLGTIWELPEVFRLGHRDFNVRLDSLGALVDLGDPRAIEPLIAALRDENSLVHKEAARALGELGVPRVWKRLIAVLRDGDSAVRQAVAEALGRIGDPRAVEPLMVALQDGDSAVCRAAAEALGLIGDSRAVEPLIATLHRDRDVHRVAAEALGRIGDPRAVEPLMVALQDRDSAVCRTAVEALGLIGDSRAVKPLIATLGHLDRDVHGEAAEALSRMAEPAVEPLIAALQDKYGRVRQAAAWALGEIGDPRAVEPLTAILQDEDSRVRSLATEALRKIGTSEALAAVEKWRRY
jgi:HEAT repeat protein